jgi:hypothetical protein
MTTEAEAAPATAEDTSLTTDHATETVNLDGTATTAEGGETTPPETSGADAAAAAETEAETEAKAKAKARQTAQDRIDELTRDKHAERRAREAAERRLAELEAKDKPAAEQPREDAEPDPTDYAFGQTDPGYIKELGAWSARQEHKRLAEQDRRSAQVRTVEQSWNDRQQSFAKDKPDYFDVLDRDWVCTTPMADAIKTSDDGAAVAYHLAQNPDEARRIAALNPLAQVREIGRLEAKLAVPAPAAAATPIPTKPASDAPAPPPQVRGTGGKFKPPPDTDDFAAFETNY